MFLDRKPFFDPENAYYYNFSLLYRNWSLDTSWYEYLHNELVFLAVTINYY